MSIYNNISFLTHVVNYNSISIFQKSCESSRSSISCKKSKTNSIRQSAMGIPSKTNANPQPASIAAPVSNVTTRYRDSRKNNQTVKLMSDRIIYNLAKYEEVRDHVNKAIQNKKVFSIFGRCKAVRDALRERGWVEKLRYRTFDNLKREIPYGDTNPELNAKKRLVLTNNLLLRCNPNFYWTVSANDNIFPNKSNPFTYPLINRVKMDDKVFTTKAGLCSALKHQHWYHISGVSDFNSPRSYNIFNELEDFQEDYRITSCTNLLKWFVRNKDSEDSIMSEKGKIPFSVIFFALKRCQGFIQRKQHKDIDKIIKEPNPSDWDTFIENYYKLIFRRQRFKVEHKNVMDFYIICANEMLRFMRKYKPEIDCEGVNNIWIIKPGASSRGRGITLSNDYKTITNISTRPRVQKYVVQKYIGKLHTNLLNRGMVKIAYLLTMYTRCPETQKYKPENSESTSDLESILWYKFFLLKLWFLIKSSPMLKFFRSNLRAIFVWPIWLNRIS